MRVRSTELIDIRAGDLILDVRNWRDHPETQAEALAGVQADVGNVSAVYVREVWVDVGANVEKSRGYAVVDGHLRASLADPDEMLPCIVLDVDEREAGLIISTYDALGDMARPDVEILEALTMECAAIGTASMASMLDIIQTAIPPTPAVMQDTSYYMTATPDHRDPILHPVSVAADIWLWVLYIPLTEYDEFIRLVRALAVHLGYTDDAAGLVMHCLEVVGATLD